MCVPMTRAGSGALADARLKSEQARIAYERHIADHGC